MTYTTLKADVATYLHRSDLTTQIPLFIANAEFTLFRELAAIELENVATGTVTSSEITLPTRFQAVQRLEVSLAGAWVTLDYSDGRSDDLSVVTAYPQFYTIETNKIRIMPPVANGMSYRLKYSEKLEALSATVATNWLLDNAGDLYLWASLAEAGKYIKDNDLVAHAQSTAAPLLDSVRNASQRKKYPVRGALQTVPHRSF